MNISPTSSLAIDHLKKYPNWVCWKHIHDGKGKPIKVPVNPKTGGNAQSNNSQTWGTYEQAKQRYKQGGMVGLGFVFTKDVGIIGIDLDDKPMPAFAEDGQLANWSSKIIKSLNSYTEVSPSGNGVHILAFGTIPNSIGSKPDHGVEMYDSVRWFTVTGKHIPGTPDTIEKRHEQVKELHEQYTPKRITKPVSVDSSHIVIPSGNYSALVRTALGAECHKIRTAPEHYKHNARFSAGAAIGNIVSATWNELDYATAFDLLMSASMSNTTLSEKIVAKDISDGLNKGMTTPRPVPTPLEVSRSTPNTYTGQPEVDTITLTVDELKRREKVGFWEGYHSCMTDFQISQWTSQGIPEIIVNELGLGYRPELIDDDTGEILAEDCFSLPFFSSNGDVGNIEYRSLIDGKVRYELDNPCLFNTQRELPTSHTVLLDNSISAIKTYLNFGTVELGGARLHFMALPKAKINNTVFDTLSNTDNVYVLLGRDTETKGIGLDLLKSVARFVRLPMPVEHMTSTITQDDFIRFLRTGERW